jgi:hypothetical protein
MLTFLIPLLNIPQDFNITLANRELRIVSKWNSADEAGWVLDIYDGVTDDAIVVNIPMITGADLLEQYEYLGLNGRLVVFTDGDETAVPTLENLGVESNVYFQTEETT